MNTTLTFRANTNDDISDILKTTSTYNNMVHKGTSKYSLVNTGQIVEHITKHTNLVPVSYKQATSSNEGTQAHTIRFRDKSLLTLNNQSEVPELVLLNSYDTSKAFKLYFGVFRIACLNGLIAGNEINHFSHKHINFDYNALTNYLDDLPQVANATFNMISQFKAKQISENIQNEIAFKALMLRDWQNNSKVIDTNYQWINQDLNYMLRPKRIEDKDNTLWNTFNIIQEKTINGARLSSTKLRAINSIPEQVKINRTLWDIASSYLQ